MMVHFNALPWMIVALLLACQAEIGRAQPPDGIDVAGTQWTSEVFYPAPFRNPPHLVLEQPPRAEHGAHGAEHGAHGAEHGAHGAEHGAHGAEHGAHGAVTVSEQPVGSHDPASAPHAGSDADPHRKPTVGSHFLHANKMPRPVAIPSAARLPVWKTPYSYGHFGASRNRQWSLHHGYQQGYTQWTLR